MYRTRVIRLPASMVQPSEIGPSASSGFIFEHLKYYCSRIFPLPAISIHIDSGIPVLIRGGEYLAIARELGHSSIQAIVARDVSDADLSELLENPAVEIVDLTKLEAEELANPVIEDWQVFYFERPLSEREKQLFEDKIVAAFEELPSKLLTSCAHPRVTSLAYCDEKARAEFKALVSVLDERWLLDCVARIQEFSATVLPVLSYQGRRHGKTSI
jgi:phosphoribosylformylglycinamidine (FGAM) synthase PurS component